MEAFTTEVQTFSNCILDDLGKFMKLFIIETLTHFAAVPTPPRDALEAAQIAVALTHSFRSGKPVFFDDNGQPMLS
jgi:myo-inositol 2-dehydrogenase/D-chiro-inositol 1-dehydrogenase